jgi:hypothetical protein
LALPIFALALLAGSTTVSFVPAFNVMMSAPPNDGYCRNRNPLAPTELDTFKVKVSTLDG